jgi:hypothetical protein
MRRTYVVYNAGQYFVRKTYFGYQLCSGDWNRNPCVLTSYKFLRDAVKACDKAHQE